MADVKFIRKNGHIIPIRSKSGTGHSGDHKPAPKKSHTAMQVKVSSKSNTAGSRFKEGFKAGASVGGVFGGLIGLQMGVPGALAGAAGGSAALGLFTGGAQAAFGPRKDYSVHVKSMRNYRGRK